MKKLLIISGLLLSAFCARAQYDHLILSRMDPVLGTARYSSMAGALGALGGNATTTKDNPAGLGIYRSCDLMFTPSMNINNDGELDVNLENFAFILNLGKTNNKHGYVTSSLGISYNRLKNYSSYTTSRNYRSSSMTDEMGANCAPDGIFNRADDLGLLDENGYSLFGGEVVNPKLNLTESGHVGEWDFSYGLNISNRVYLGLTLGVVSLDYTQTAHYYESSMYEDESIQELDELYLDNYYNADGNGVNFKIGAIVRATDWLRLGFAFHTPTYYDVRENYSSELDYYQAGYLIEGETSDDPTVLSGDPKYELQTPLKLQLSGAFVLGKRALIGVEYNYEDYTKMRVKDKGEVDEAVRTTCDEIMNVTHTLKVGAEVKLGEYFAIRGGFAAQTSPADDNLMNNLSTLEWDRYSPVILPQKSYYITGGFGYAGEHFYTDIAYVQRNQSETIYDSFTEISEPIKLDQISRDILLTFGWRF